jgi:complement component 1 Q subcomponent-binding protein
LTGDSALSAALASEHAYEVEAAGENPQDPDFLQSVKEQGVWQIQDVKGSDSVTLTRKFGNES